MTKIKLICEQCGGQIKLDELKEIGTCTSCGTEQIITKEPIINVSSNTKPNYSGSLEEFYEVFANGKDLYAMEQYEEANDVLEKAVKMQPKNWEVQYYYALTCGKNMSAPAIPFKAAYKLAPKEEKEKIFNIMFTMAEDLEEVAAAMHELNRDDYRTWFASGKYWNFNPPVKMIKNQNGEAIESDILDYTNAEDHLFYAYTIAPDEGKLEIARFVGSKLNAVNPRILKQWKLDRVRIEKEIEQRLKREEEIRWSSLTEEERQAEIIAKNKQMKKVALPLLYKIPIGLAIATGVIWALGIIIGAIYLFIGGFIDADAVRRTEFWRFIEIIYPFFNKQ